MRKHFTFWILALALFIGFLWLFSGVLLPFVAGLAVAYLLNPVVAHMGRAGISRVSATIILLSVFVLALLIAVAAGVPLLLREMTMLAQSFPDMLLKLKTMIEEWVPAVQPYFSDIQRRDVSGLIEGHMAQALKLSADMVQGIVSGGKAAVQTLLFTALMPVVAYFMMTQWPIIVETVDDLLPRRQAPLIRNLLRQIDERISGFIRGQFIVCLILTMFYAVALAAVGLQYGFLIGFVGGILSIIPFVGSLFVLVSSVAIGLMQVPENGWSVLILAVSAFSIGNFLEGNFLTPKIVGDRVGLHPLWILFALLAGGNLMGLLGMLIAIPVAAAVSVLVIFALGQYKASMYYHGGHLIPPKDFQV